MGRNFLVAWLGILALAGAIARAHPRWAPPAGPDPKAAPEFPDKAEWVQAGPLKLGDLRGRVVVVHFWTNGCINCIHNYPVYRAWQKRYAGKGVTIIGVHTPEFKWEAAPARVRARARANGLAFPIVLDNDAAIWRRWENRFWPAIYLVDRKGRVRHLWEGELDLQTAEGKAFAAHIDELLAEEP
jgi:thiol-disulfide isomerase/thioredoxin